MAPSKKKPVAKKTATTGPKVSPRARGGKAKLSARSETASRKPAARKASAKRRPAARKPAARQPAARRIAAGPRPEITTPMGIPAVLFDSASGRERALDALGKWFVAAMLAAPNQIVARETIWAAISTFHEIRNAAGEGTLGDAGHFFQVDGAGGEESVRPVPWEVLARSAPPESVARWDLLFEGVLSELS